MQTTKRSKTLLIVLTIFTALAMTACGEEEAVNPTPDEESFQDSTGGGSA
ncbi:hypothetical protein MHM84_11335 [Halomonas sp. McH1-25]|nr:MULTISPECIES: hypothetical protein [unclassified Halomonas]MCG7600384.1 hypothetical protein [Halomonas sp. McH1-25]MCP1344006.1 hypothetical protein [Halomonas sp. FL8]MCP1362060.1 hypothetical protein [Halomonas sp. BBD45]